MLYGPIVRLQRGTPWVAWNKQLMRFSVSTVLAAPGRYLAWVVGGTARAVGRLLVTNLPFVLAVIALTGVYFVRLVRAPEKKLHVANALDVPVILSVTLAYTLVAGALMVLVTFPASRYLDTAGLFVSALPIYLLLSLIGWPSSAAEETRRESQLLTPGAS